MHLYIYIYGERSVAQLAEDLLDALEIKTKR